LLYQLSYRFRLRRNKSLQKENKNFEEIKDNIEYIKATGSEKTEIQKDQKLMKKTSRNLFALALSKSLYGTIPNYILLEYLPVFLLFTLAKTGFWAVLYIKLDKLFSN
jgi:glucose-6-phosphate 1-dehydrogenase